MRQMIEMFMRQVAKVCGGAMGGGQGQEHFGFILSMGLHMYYNPQRLIFKLNLCLTAS